MVREPTTGGLKSRSQTSHPCRCTRHGRRTEARRGGYGGDRRLRRIGVLLAARGRARGQGRHAVRRRRRIRSSSPRSAGRRVAFLPRHGRRHTIPPHRINYRANVWAMRSLGVKAAISPCAAGSLQLAVKPGDFVVCDQFVDRTCGRADTFYDGPIVTHLSSAEIYDPVLRAARDRHDPRPRHRGPRDAARSSSSRARASRRRPSRSGSATPAGRSST